MLFLVLILVLTPALTLCILAEIRTGGQRSLRRAAILTGSFFIIILLGLSVGGFISHLRGTARVKETKAYYEGHVPALDAWKAEHGSFPDSLETLGLNLGTPPIEDWGYSVSTDGQGFAFQFPDPRPALPSIDGFGFAYTADWREWTRGRT